MAESAIVAGIRAMLKRRGCWSVKFHGSAFTPAGTPDILACCGGRFVALEVKQPHEIPTPIQSFTLQEIRDTGGVAAWVTSIQEAESVLRKADL